MSAKAIAPDALVGLGAMSRGEREAVRAAIGQVVDSGQFVLGTQVDRFEDVLAEALRIEHVVGVGNGTDGLLLALLSLSFEVGDEVIVPANAGGFASLAASACGLVPVPADADPDTLLLDPADVAARSTSRTRAVVATHLYGQVMDLSGLRAWCDNRSVALIEDCSHAQVACSPAGMAGTWGHVAVFSFYPTKNLGAFGDAGAVATGDSALAGELRSRRQYGWGHRGVIERLGANSRLDELQAAILTARLPWLAQNNEARRNIVRAYRIAVAGIGALRILPTDSDGGVAHQAVVCTADRRDLVSRLSARGIGTAVRYPVPDHLMPLFGTGPVDHRPNAELACEEVLSLPCYPGMSDELVDVVCAELAAAHERTPRA